MRLNTLKLGFVALITALPMLAHAHAGHEHTSSLMSGFTHPLGGLDHLLAMLAIGLWAASLGGRAQFIVPMAFVGAMLIGGGLTIAGVHVPFIEQGILLSVILTGVLLLAAVRSSLAICIAIAGVFAIFHGAAHGLEMPLNSSGIQYALGFAFATALLHIVGMGFGTVITRLHAPIANRIIGFAIALSGVFLAIA